MSKVSNPLTHQLDSLLKQKAKEMREELRSHISLFYGPSAWDEIVRIEGDMRKKRREQVYAAEERKQKILEWTIGLLLAAALSAVSGFIIYMIGLGNGSW